MQIAITVLIATLEYARFLLALLSPDSSPICPADHAEFQVQPRETTALLNNLRDYTRNSRHFFSFPLFICSFAVSWDERLKICKERLENRLKKC